MKLRFLIYYELLKSINSIALKNVLCLFQSKVNFLIFHIFLDLCTQKNYKFDAENIINCSVHLNNILLVLLIFCGTGLR